MPEIECKQLSATFAPNSSARKMPNGRFPGAFGNRFCAAYFSCIRSSSSAARRFRGVGRVGQDVVYRFGIGYGFRPVVGVRRLVAVPCHINLGLHAGPRSQTPGRYTALDGSHHQGVVGVRFWTVFSPFFEFYERSQKLFHMQAKQNGNVRYFLGCFNDSSLLKVELCRRRRL